MGKSSDALPPIRAYKAKTSFLEVWDDQPDSKLFGGGTDTSALMEGLMDTVDRATGDGSGLTSLLGKFDAAGMGDKVKSWVGDGPNQSLSGDEVKQALSEHDMEQIAQKAGIPMDKAADGIASALPEAVNKLTPEGRVPAPNEFQELIKKIPGI